MTLRRAARIGASVVGALQLVVGSCHERASAQTSTKDPSYRKGVAFEVAGNYNAALHEFESIAPAQRLAVTRMHIASCKAHLGLFLAAESDLVALLADPKLGAAERETAQGDLDLIRKKTPKLTIVLLASAQGADVSLDGVALVTPAMRALDAGAHVVIAKKGTKEIYHREVTLHEGSKVTLEVDDPNAPTKGAKAAIPTDPDARAAEAKRTFEEGEVLRAAGQYLAALDAYLRSRALVPRASNTINAAFCLYQLGRYDEALELFDEALTKYPESQLAGAARANAKETMARLEPKVGRLEISANVDGTVVIDGRVRGKLPLLASLRALPGKHVVRVLRDGFVTFEKVADVVAGEVTRIDGKLEMLVAAGLLHVACEAELEGGILTVDGAPVGTLPWEGTLAPGAHVVQAISGDFGTGPTLANVITSQTVTLALVGKALGPERRVLVDPPTAALSIDGVAIGHGTFQGRLPMGVHVVEARELGYVSARVPLEVFAGDGADFPVVLALDAAHPRWTRGNAGRFTIEIVGGFLFASSFGNDGAGLSTGWCRVASPCTQTSAPKGPMIGLGGSYELPSRLGFFARVGYLSLGRTSARQIASSFSVGGTIDEQFALVDDVRISGPFAMVGVGYRLMLGGAFDLDFRLGLGAAFIRAKDTLTGTGTAGGRTLSTSTQGSGVSSSALLFTAMPSLALGVSLEKHWRLTAGMALPVSLLVGPTLKLGDTKADDPARNCAAFPRAIDCAPGQRLDPDLSAYGRFVGIVPQVSLGYWF